MPFIPNLFKLLGFSQKNDTESGGLILKNDNIR